MSLEGVSLMDKTHANTFGQLKERLMKLKHLIIDLNVLVQIATNISPPPTTPSYIGNNSTQPSIPVRIPYQQDCNLLILYGMERGVATICCSFPGSGVTPPWFVKDLPSSTTDNIEMRLCQPNTSDGSTPIEIVELYVQ